MRTVAVIQARVNSTRLPNKILLPLGGHSSLWWTTARVDVSNVNKVVVATTNSKLNKKITKELLPFGCDVFRFDGDEQDVLGRVIACGDYYQADAIVDITSDCPLVDPHHINNLLKIFDSGIYDYVSNINPRSWPDGLDIQIYKLDALKKVKKMFKPEHHAGWNISQHSYDFSNFNIPAPFNMYLPDLGLTLDTPQDYKLLKIIFDKFGKDPIFKVEDVVFYLLQNSELLKINKDVIRKKPEEG